jgi:hypothetical protein
MKSLVFKRENDGHYIIIGYRGAALGVIEPMGRVFRKRVVATEFERDVELTAECLRQMADFMDSVLVEPCPSGAQQRQGAICRTCRGSGVIGHMNPGDGMSDTSSECSKCGGTGRRAPVA